MTSFRLLTTKKCKLSILKNAQEKRIEIVEKEFIKIIPVPADQVRNGIKKIMLQTATIVFTSKNAVSIVGAAKEYKSSTDWTIFCLDGNTLLEVKKYFGYESISGTASDASSLADLIIETHHEKLIMFFCGDKRRNDLPDKLRKNGFDVNEIIVYETRFSPEKLNEYFDGVAFFSPSAVESFFSVNPPDEDVIYFSIGKTTTSAIKRYTNNIVVTCSVASEEEMIGMVEKRRK